jgi:regulator of sirC expression with transglutaminase-like and TPR domain
MRAASPHDPHLEEYLDAIARPPREWELFNLSLHISRIGDPGLSMDDCREEVRGIRRRVENRLPSHPNPYTIIEHANAVLYEELGYRGNTENYDDPLNSLMSQVLHRRTGIPITLSILYREIVGRLGLETWAVGMPGHFLLGFRASSRELFLDSFAQGQILLEDDCRAMCDRLFDSQLEFDLSYLSSIPASAIVLRMLMNLKQVYRGSKQAVMTLRVLNRRIPLLSDPLPEILERGMICVELTDYREALEDFRFFVENTPDESIRQVIETRIGELERLAGGE